MYNVKTIKNICYKSENGDRGTLDLYLPEGLDSFPVIVYFYGGGMEDGFKEKNADIGEDFAKAGIALAAPDYRLYPDVKFPAFIEDVAASIAWVHGNIKDYGNCNGIFVGGHSAGAYLTMMACFDKNYLKPYNIDPSRLSGFIFASGQPTTHFNVLKERGIDEKKVVIDDAAPLYHVSSDTPPMLVLCADKDIPNRLEQTKLFVSTLSQFNIESDVDFKILTNNDHGSYIHRKDGNPSLLFKLSKRFILSHLKK